MLVPSGNTVVDRGWCYAKAVRGCSLIVVISWQEELWASHG
jgi:hypothetical protein